MEASSFGLSHDTKYRKHGLEEGTQKPMLHQYQNPAKKHASAKLDIKLYVAGVKRQT